MQGSHGACDNKTSISDTFTTYFRLETQPPPLLVTQSKYLSIPLLVKLLLCPK